MKTKRKTTVANVLYAILFNTLIGVALSVAFEFNAVAGAVGVNAVGVGFNMLRHSEYAQHFFPTIHFAMPEGIVTAGLAKEVYLAELLQQYRPNGAWLGRARDLSAYVSNDVINFAEAGADPGIVEDYDHVDPLDVANDEDTPKTVSLKSFSTERSKITETAQDARAYSIMSDRVMRHANTLNMNILKYAAKEFAPAANGTYTPIVRTSGADYGDFLKAKLDDIIALDTAMRNLDVDGPRILVLNPTHLGHLQAEDKDLFKGFVPSDPNASFKLFGFDCYVSTATPRYTTNAAPAIKAWNAVNESTDLIASFAFVASEVCRAQGSIKLFKDLEDPAYQASFISTRVRFIAKQMRAKFVGALVAAED